MSVKQTYKNLREGYQPIIEDFFMRYALNGNMVNKDVGTRAGMPGFGPRPYPSPVLEPSPLESQFVYDYALYGPRGALKYANKPVNLENQNIPFNYIPPINIMNQNTTLKPYPLNYYTPDDNLPNQNNNPWFDYYHAKGPTIGVYNDN